MQLIFRTKDIQLKKEVLSFIDEWKSDSSHIKTQTSGSTGEAKIISIQKKHMLASARMTRDFLHLRKGMNALLCLSPKTIGGKMMIVRAIVLDLNLIITDLCSTPLAGVVDDIHFAAMVPLQVYSSFTDSVEQLKNIEKLIIGGGPISSQLATTITDFPNAVYQTFGMTETISHVAMRKLSAGEINYTALPSVAFYEREGKLIIHAPKLGVENLQTNDLVELVNDQTFRWIGRNDFVINSGGIKHSPEEIEKKISPLFDCDYFVTGLTDSILGEKVILCVESSSKKSKKR